MGAKEVIVRRALRAFVAGALANHSKGLPQSDVALAKICRKLHVPVP